MKSSKTLKRTRKYLIVLQAFKKDELTAHNPTFARAVSELRIFLKEEILAQEAQTSRAERYSCIPPSIAEFLLTALAATRAAEAMIGDLKNGAQ
jgi:hypothetical protein